MTSEWSLPVWAVLVGLVGVLAVLVVLVIVVRASAARVALARAEARSEADDLRAQLLRIDQRVTGLGTPAAASPGEVEVEEHEYVITRLGEMSTDEPRESQESREARGAVPVVDAPLFADLVLREGVVQAASFAAGLRRALSPEHLNRVRFEMRREIKRARKKRRTDLRQARREYEARDRAGEAAA